MFAPQVEHVLHGKIATGNQALGHGKAAAQLVQFFELAGTPLIGPKFRQAGMHQAVFVIDRHAVISLRGQGVNDKWLLCRSQHLGRHINIGAQPIPAAGVVPGLLMETFYTQVLGSPGLVRQGLRFAMVKTIDRFLVVGR